MSIFSFFRALLAIAVLIGGSASAAEKAEAPNPGFAARCKDPSVEVCLALNSEEEIARLRFTPSHLNASNRIQWDADAKAARFTIPSRSPADSSGQLHIPFPQPLADVYFSFDVRYPRDLLRYPFKSEGSWKIFILGQGKEGCAPYELVGYYSHSYPGFYYICRTGSQIVAVQNPFGDNPSQFDYQPGGDTACPRTPDSRAKPCAFFEPDEWVTYQMHLNAITAVLEVWQTVRGKTLKIIEYQMPNFPAHAPKYEWLKLTPYNTGKDATEDHPSFSLWYRRVIVATRKIPFPGTK